MTALRHGDCPAESMRWSGVLIAYLFLMGAATFAQGRPPNSPRFEVASIRLSPGCRQDGVRGGGGGLNVLAHAALAGQTSPDRVTLRCISVRELIQMAWVRFAGEHFDPLISVPIEGGPSWMDSDYYDITAKAERPQAERTLYSLMLQTLLLDRFHLKLRRETRDIPVYALSIAKGGPKMPVFSAGTCVPVDFVKLVSQFPPGDLAKLPAGQEYCRNVGNSSGPNVVYEARGTTIAEFCRFGIHLDRPVIDRTGLAGRYDIRLEYAASDTSDEPAGPSIFTAVQQELGLKLDPANGPGEFIVIESLTRPIAN